MDLSYILADKTQKKLAKEFVEKQGLRFENDTDATLLYFNGKEIIGTSSFKGKIIKGVAVRKDYRSVGLGKQLVYRTIELQRRENIVHSIIFTSPNASGSFQGMGFNEVCRADPWVVMLEYGFLSFENFIFDIIDNINNEPDFNTAFIVHEDINKKQLDIILDFSSKSYILLFLSAKLIEKDITEQLNNILSGNNVAIIDGKDYFFPYNHLPTYYMKNPNIDAYQAWVTLDSKLFCRVGKVLGIQNRVLWSDHINYNKIAIPILEEMGIKICEV